MIDDWIDALGGMETYRRRYKRFGYVMGLATGLLGGLIGISLYVGREGMILGPSWAPWLGGLLVAFFAIAALFGWFVPDPDDLEEQISNEAT